MTGDVVVAVLHVAVVAAGAPLLVGVLRTLKARLVGRRGPAPWQPYRDLRKLFGKTPVVSTTTSWLFRVTPYVLMSTMITAALAAPVLSSRPPLAFAGPLPGTIVAPDDRGALVRLSGNASSDPDGDPLTFSWTDNGAVIATAAVAEVRLAVGSHSIVLTVSDGRGGTRSAGPQLVNVTAPAPLTVRSINPSSGKRGETLTAIVNGTAFQQGASVRVEGDFVFADTDFISGTQLRVRIVVSVRATLGARSITVTNPNGASATLPHAFTVEQ